MQLVNSGRPALFPASMLACLLGQSVYELAVRALGIDIDRE